MHTLYEAKGMCINIRLGAGHLSDKLLIRICMYDYLKSASRIYEQPTLQEIMSIILFLLSA